MKKESSYSRSFWELCQILCKCENPIERPAMLTHLCTGLESPMNSPGVTRFYFTWISSVRLPKISLGDDRHFLMQASSLTWSILLKGRSQIIILQLSLHCREGSLNTPRIIQENGPGLSHLVKERVGSNARLQSAIHGAFAAFFLRSLAPKLLIDVARKKP
jgi:hypothetical protein